MVDPQKDEHIEELLSKLQGIFGKLSNAEEEESRTKEDLPKTSPAPTPYIPPAPPSPAPTPAPPPVTSTPFTASELTAPQPKEVPFDPPATTPAPAAPPPVSITAPQGPGYVSVTPPTDPEKIVVPTAVYYPAGRESEAKSLAAKLELMTPKFTKVAFRLKVLTFMTYDPKTDWKDFVMSTTSDSECQTAFVVVDRPLDDTRKKAIATETEARNIYFQDVPMSSIEKKAYYTDILLGLVFFFDSHKPPTPGENT